MSLNIESFRIAANAGDRHEVFVEKNQLESRHPFYSRFVRWFAPKAVVNWNNKAKTSFLDAIEKEYNSALANHVRDEVQGFKSLTGRNVREILQYAENNKERFTKVHHENAQRELDSIIDSHVKEAGGQEGFETKCRELASQTYGLELPEIDGGMFNEMKDRLQANYLEKFKANPNSPLNKPSLGDCTQTMAEIALTNMLLGGVTEGLKKQLQDILNEQNPPKRTRNLTGLLRLSNEIVNASPANKPQIGPVLQELFSQAHQMNPPDFDLMRKIADATLDFGMLPLEIPGLGDLYANKADEIEKQIQQLDQPQEEPQKEVRQELLQERQRQAQALPSQQLQNLCAAELCYRKSNQQEKATQTLEQIGKNLTSFARQHSPLLKEPNQPLKSPPDVAKDRQTLAEIRQSKGKELSTRFHEFTRQIYLECLDEFGVDHDQQTFMLLGSGSRDEMCPFSDLEYMILTDSEEKDPNLVKALTYFELRITALGETPLGKDQHLPIKEGFCADPGGNTPRNSEFFGTPERTGKRIADVDKVTLEVLAAAKLLTGKPERVQRYLDTVQKALDAPSTQNPNRSIAQEYAVRNLEDQQSIMRSERNPIMLSEEELQQVDQCNIKQLARFPYFVASSLCKYHQVPLNITNTKERLQALEERGVLSKEECQTLSNAFDFFNDLRVRTEMHYGGQMHTLYKEAGEGRMTLSEKEWGELEETIRTLMPLQAKTEQFIQAPDSLFQKRDL